MDLSEMPPRYVGSGAGAVVARGINDLRFGIWDLQAKLPDQLNNISERFGPHPAYSAGAQLATNVEPDKIVKTHCCFCGQQCGIQLKVKDNVVIGFEPWEDFPFNQGMLCPKGVKRYLQSAHRDRLLTALERDESAEGGF